MSQGGTSPPFNLQESKTMPQSSQNDQDLSPNNSYFNQIAANHKESFKNVNGASDNALPIENKLNTININHIKFNTIESNNSENPKEYTFKLPLNTAKINSSSPISEEEDCDYSPQNGSDIVNIRSTSFRDIKSMIPRGYGKMKPAKLTKDSENSENESNFPAGELFDKDHLELLDELRQRNSAKWKVLGYDPSHGKGDMRGSATLASFSPLKIMRSHKLWEKAENDQFRSRNINNIKSSIPKQVLQSYSLCIKPNLRTLKRVNSSNEPLNLFVHPHSNSANDDANEEEEVIEISAISSQFASGPKVIEDDDDDFFPQNKMTAAQLLNGPDFFQDDESDSVIVEEEEEEEEFEEEESNNKDDDYNDHYWQSHFSSLNGNSLPFQNKRNEQNEREISSNQQHKE